MSNAELSETEYKRRYDEFLRRLRQARLDSGLTQEEVAQRLGRSQSLVSRSEQGLRRVDIVEIQMFADIYSKSLSYFMSH